MLESANFTCGDTRRKKEFAEVEKEEKKERGGENVVWGLSVMVRLHLFILKWQREVQAGGGVEMSVCVCVRALGGGRRVGRGREQIQTRWRLEEGMDGAMEESNGRDRSVLEVLIRLE